ncbi:MAG: hypothetical protein JHC98_00850 [Thermoleophilaceae bacterium]|nr:hypothetical protein [Thermoleophilaceae bacterium]
MRYCDYLHSCVLLIGSSALALILISAGSLAGNGGTTLVILSSAWIVLSIVAGLWIGGGPHIQESVRAVLSKSRPEPIFPKIEPPAVLLSRLWPVLAITILAAVTSYWFPQLAVAAAGYGLLWALAWRRQSDAVLAIEERDAVHFWIVRSSPFAPPKLVRVPAM